MKIGIALSGGGVRGVAHIGVLKALEEMGVTIQEISGTSAGSLVGCLYASGLRPDEIFDLIKEMSLLKSLRPAWAFTGLFTMDGLKDILHQNIKEDNYKALKVPLTVAATNIKSGKVHYFSDGPLISTIVASCSIPVIFNPVTIDDNLYVDGGLVDNLPAKPLRQNCDLVIGSHCNHVSNDFDIKSFRTILERSMLIAIQSNIKPNSELCDVFIEPPRLDRFSSIDLSKVQDIFDFSYQFTKENFLPHHFQIQ